MSLHIDHSTSDQRRPDEPQSLPRAEFQMAVLDELITSGKTILYNGEDFENDVVVGKFVKAHRPLSSALLGLDFYAYVDPCTCCIPAYGRRNYKPDVITPESVLEYI